MKSSFWTIADNDTPFDGGLNISTAQAQYSFAITVNTAPVVLTTGNMSSSHTNFEAAIRYAPAKTDGVSSEQATNALPSNAPYIIDNHQPYLAISIFVPRSGNFPPRSGLEAGINDGAYLGGMRLFAGAYAPSETSLAKGQILNVSGNTALFSLLGNNYGGDGMFTFALPNFEGRAIVGAGQGDGLSLRNIGSQYGTNTLEINRSVLPTAIGGEGYGFENNQASLATTYVIQVQGTVPDTTSSSTVNNLNMIGLVTPFGGNFTPAGYMPCDGRILQISDYSTLFAVIGATYGGDGITTFALPDLSGRTAVGKSDLHPLGDMFGNEGYALQLDQMPTEMGGAGVAVDNTQPSLALNFIIATTGLYPSQSAMSAADPVEPFLGEIAISAFTVLPRGWMRCEGQLLNIAQYQPLFSILGTAYGGDGIRTFALPDFRNRTPVGTGDAVALGERGGSESYTVNSAAIPDMLFLGSAAVDTFFGGGGSDQMFGNDGNDRLVGNGGDDNLQGGGGRDTMEGGAGNDHYDVDDAGDQIIELSGQGYDEILSTVSFSLAFTFVDELWLVGTGNINATGNGLSNFLFGTSGNNRLDGGANNDTMTGGLGDDTYVVSSAGDVINENAGAGTDTVESAVTFTLSDVLENLTLTGSANINGTGNAGNNVLTGNSGINTLAGKAGDDTYFVQNTGDNVIEATNEGTDLINSTVTYSLAGRQVENLTLTGSAAIDGTGNGLANILTGNSGANLLDGGANNDTMNGGAGNDTYIISAVGDVVNELPSQGTDTVQTAFTTTLGANLENLTLTGSADLNGTGNALNNVLTGNAGVNVLTGGAGNDTYYIQNAADNVVETSGNGSDVIFSTVTYSLNLRYAEALNLIGADNVNATGNSLGNTLGGNDGNNTINGKGGTDNLSGGLGADIFLFEAASGTDTITDFSAAQNDTININAYTGGVANAGLVAQVGGNVVISLGGSNVITVNNTTTADVLAHIVW